MRKVLLLSFMLMLAWTTSLAQRSLSGKVTDANGNPIVGASVVIQNTKSGTVTKDDGTFSITVPANARALVISAIGMTTQEVTIGSQSNLAVTLQAGSDKSMQEVVVTAMGIRRTEKALGYAVSKVDPSTMLQKSEPNILNALAGKVPGVDIRAGQGAPGAATRIQIRGVSSFRGSEPLIVVDGVPYSNPLINTSNPFSGGGTYGSGLNDLDPNDIESINVLKGAAAASLYGSRAANGVLLITTKSGAPKRGAKSLNVTYRGGYSVE
ncbi:MAG TPA: TonB-dependent receptor plug domain-containing protein, partial [Chitinophagaceae bacterium]|nr:TonB-dependent receptor plug domain-containing protein [Chitinophagaceae bacterium]